jgi:DivIVA domain-containing protein
MTAEEVANRGFASAFRGVSETEVRNFLKRIADEISAAAAREAELTAQVEELREELRNPTPPTEQQLLDSLGEETARVLRSAQEAAEDIRSRAEDRAATLVREAQEQATELRDSSTADAARRTEEAERVSSEREQAADAYATRARDDAERDAAAVRERAEREAEEAAATATAAAEAEIEAAKETGRGLVNEARAVRERVLGDLGRRRELLQAQVDELRAGRDRLLDAYRVVKRTLGDATDALAQVEARAADAAAEGAAAGEGADVPEDAAAPGAAIEPEPAAEGAAVVEDADAPGVEAAPAAAIGEAIEPDSGPAVDALFARLRAEKPEPAPVDTAAEGAVEAAAEARAADPAAPGPAATGRADALEERAGPGAAIGEAAAIEEDERAARAAVLDPLGAELVRKAKRALQDEQNDLLDRMRQVKKGRPEAAAVLPTPDAARDHWVEVIRDAMDAAYRGGWEQLGDAGAGAAPGVTPSELVTERASALVELLRDRLVAAIDDPADDTDEVTQRLGARFREFKGQELDAALGDLLAVTWARGTYDAAPPGTRLRWVPVAEGQCPDCDDNALEPTLRGEPFPTGQAHPPAHPGCRCLLVVAES